MLGMLLFVLLSIGYWCPCEVSAASPCVPTVKGEPFVQFVENSRDCEVDEKLLKLFNPESFNESIVNNTIGNFMCIGFMSALAMAPQDFWLYDPLKEIPDKDFCFDTKMMTALGRIVNGSVFDSNSNIFIVSKNTIRYCKGICEDYSELCWAFGTIARVVLLKQSSLSTTATITTEPTSDTTTSTEPTNAPTPVTTEPVYLPDISNSKGTDSSNDDTTPQQTDNMSEQSPSKVLGAFKTDSELKTSRVNDTTGQVAEGHGDNDEDTDDSREAHSSPTTDNKSQDITTTAISVNISQNTTSTSSTTTTNITTTTTPENITTSPTNAPTNEEATSIDTPSIDVVVPDDNQFEDNNVDTDDQDDGDNSDHDDDLDLDGLDLDNGDHNHINSGIDQIDDDDDDGYSYWHFAAILLFILFLGVAGYLASHNRKKVR